LRPHIAILALAIAGAICAATRAPAAPIAIGVSADAPACVRFGAEDLAAALAANGGAAEVRSDFSGADVLIGVARVAGATPPEAAESFTIARRGGQLLIVGRDAVGAMYGALDAAEQVRWAGRGVRLAEAVKPKSESPYLALRGTNPFITVQAVQDPNSWFFSADYWRGYLEMLARNRINWLDLHAMYNLVSTGFPNFFCFFVESEKFPGITIPAAEKARNLEMLNRIFKMAHERGIKTGVMNYNARWQVGGYAEPPYQATDENLRAYARECAARLLRACPDLDMLGFRIGESGKPPEFFTSYLDGARDSGRADISLYTRSWAADPKNVKDLGALSPWPFLIEIKYNGEQLGLPYHVQGDRMAGKGSYSYQSYLDRPRRYQVIWQVRANGTHRILRWGDPDFVRRTVRTFAFGGAAGYTLEPMTAYYPQAMAQVLAPSTTAWCDWMWQRNWLWHTLWGRLSYNPEAPARIWDYQFARRFGRAGPDVERMVAASSKIVPFLYATYCFGPDHRNMAIEFETGGDLNTFVKTQALDDSVFQSVKDYVSMLIAGGASGRYSPVEVAARIGEYAQATEQAIAQADAAVAAAGLGDAALADYRSAKLDAEAVCWLAEYHRTKRLAAVDYELYRRVGGDAHKEAALVGVRRAMHCWRRLAEVTAQQYRPLLDTLRMHTTQYTWASQLPKLRRDLVLLAEAKPGAEVLPRRSDDAAKPAIGDLRLAWTRPAAEATVRVKVSDDSGVAKVILWHRPMPSENKWQATEMRTGDGGYVAAMPVTPEGALYRIEALDRAGNGAQYPDVLEETPYRVLQSWEP
jgi:hypothetical protein